MARAAPNRCYTDPMTDDAPAETPMQRALRMKTEAAKAKAGAPGDKPFKPRQSAAMPAGASKPWMKRL